MKLPSAKVSITHFKGRSIYSYVLLITALILTLALVFGYGQLSAALGVVSSHHSNHDQHLASYCLAGCVSVSPKEKHPSPNKYSEDYDKDPRSLPLNTAPLRESRNGLLSDAAIWKHSSWQPPDRLLESSAYTTSL